MSAYWRIPKNNQNDLLAVENEVVFGCNTTDSRTAQLEAGGKPSTWLSPGRLVELSKSTPTTEKTLSIFLSEEMIHKIFFLSKCVCRKMQS